MHYDWITIEKGDAYFFGLPKPKKMLPKMIHRNQQAYTHLTYLQILPTLADSPLVYIRHVSTALFLSATCNTRINHLLFSPTQDHNCLFRLDKSANLSYSFFNVATQKYIRVHINQGMEPQIWLDHTPEAFKIVVIRRAISQKFLNNCDVITIKSRGGYLGVQKKYPLAFTDKYSERNNKIHHEEEIAEMNPYFALANNIIICNKQPLKKESIIYFMWEVKKKQSHPHYIIDSEQITIQHLQTGLYLTHSLQLCVSRTFMRLSNIHAISCDLDPTPLYLSRSLLLDKCQSVLIQTTSPFPFLRLFNCHLSQPMLPINYYAYLYSELTTALLPDCGLYFLQCTLLLLQKHSPLLQAMLKFMVKVIDSNILNDKIKKKLLKIMGQAVEVYPQLAVHGILALNLPQEAFQLCTLLIQTCTVEYNYYLVRTISTILDNNPSIYQSKHWTAFNGGYFLNGLTLTSEFGEHSLAQICAMGRENKTIPHMNIHNTANVNQKPTMKKNKTVRNIPITSLDVLVNATTFLYTSLYLLQILCLLYEYDRKHIPIITAEVLSAKDPRICSCLLTLLLKSPMQYTHPVQYVVCAGALTQNTPLADVLAFCSDPTPIPQTQILQIMTSINTQNRTPDNIKYITKLIHLLCKLLWEAAYTIRVLFSIEIFVLRVTNMFNQSFQGNQLFTSVRTIFKVILMHRKRLIAYPLYQECNKNNSMQQSEQNMLLTLYKNTIKSSKVDLNYLQQHIGVYQSTKQFQIMVFERQQCDKQLVCNMEVIINEISDFLQLILTNQDRVNEEWVKQMNNGVHKILQALQKILPNTAFSKYSFAFILSIHLFDLLIILLEKDFDDSITVPILRFLIQEQSSQNILRNINRTKVRQLVGVVRKKKYPKLLLTFIASEYEKLQASIAYDIYELFYQTIIQNQLTNENVLRMIGTLLEVHSFQQHKLYSKLVSVVQNRKLLSQLKTARCLKSHHYTKSLQILLPLLFRLCIRQNYQQYNIQNKFQHNNKNDCQHFHDQKKVITKLQPNKQSNNKQRFNKQNNKQASKKINDEQNNKYYSLLPQLNTIINYDQLQQIAKMQQPNYCLIRCFFMYFISSDSQQFLPLCLDLLSRHSAQQNQLQTYKADDPGRNYWSILAFIPFYLRPEGVLPYIAKLILSGRTSRDALIKIIPQLLSIAQMLHSSNQTHLLQIQIHKIFQLLSQKYIQHPASQLEESKVQIFKLLQKHHFLQSFLNAFRIPKTALRSSKAIYQPQHSAEHSPQQSAMIMIKEELEYIEQDVSFKECLLQLKKVTKSFLSVYFELEQLLLQYYECSSFLSPLLRYIEECINFQRNATINEAYILNRVSVPCKELSILNIRNDLNSNSALGITQGTPIMTLFDYVTSTKLISDPCLLLDCFNRDYRDIPNLKYCMICIESLLSRLVILPASVQNELIAYIYKACLIARTQLEEQFSLLMKIIDIYVAYQIKTRTIHSNIYFLLEQQCLKHIGGLPKILKMSVAIKLPLPMTQIINSFIKTSLTNVLKIDFNSQNMSFYEDISTVITIFDYLQGNNIASEEYAETLVQMQCYLSTIKMNQYSHNHQQCIRSLIVQSLSYFHSLDQSPLWNIQMLRSRREYVTQMPISHVYVQFQKEYGFLKIDNKVRAYPKTIVKEEFKIMLMECKDPIERKQTTLNYVLSFHQSHSMKVPILQYSYAFYSCLLLIAFYILLFVSFQPATIIPWFISINLVLLILSVLKALSIVYYKMHMNKSQTPLRYILSKHTPTLIISLILLFINIVCYFSVKYYPLLLGVYLLQCPMTVNKIIQIMSEGVSFFLVSAVLFILACIGLGVIQNQNESNKANQSMFTFFINCQIENNLSCFGILLGLTSMLQNICTIIIIVLVLKKYSSQQVKQIMCPMCNISNHSNIANHIMYEHNLQNYVELFEYLLENNPYFSAQEKQIKKRIINNDKTLLK